MTDVTAARLRAERVYVFACGGEAFLFALWATLAAVRRITVVGMNPLELVLVGTVLELSAFLGELPTGVVADVHGRRRSVVIGLALVGGGFLLESSTLSFGAIFAAQAIWGVGATFISGAREAWIADEVGDARAADLFLRGAQAEQWAGLAGIGVATVLGGVALALPMAVGGVLYFVLAGWLSRAMHESRAPIASLDADLARGRAAWRAFRATLANGIGAVRRRPTLVRILAIAALLGMWSESIDRLWQAHLIETYGLPGLADLDTATWFGLLTAGASLLSIGAVALARRLVDTTTSQAIARVLLLLNALLVAAALLFSVAPGIGVAVAAFWSTGMLRRILYPLLNGWTNQQVGSDVRATVLSMRAQSDALGQIAGGPAIGAVALAWGLPSALALSALALLPVLLLYRPGRSGRSCRSFRSG